MQKNPLITFSIWAYFVYLALICVTLSVSSFFNHQIQVSPGLPLLAT